MRIVTRLRKKYEKSIENTKIFLAFLIWLCYYNKAVYL